MKKALLFLLGSFIFSTMAFAEPEVMDATPVGITADNSNVTNSVDQSETSISLSNQMKVVSKNAHQESPQLKYSADVKYPQIQGKLSKGAVAFNEHIQKVISDAMADFKTTASLDQVNMKNVPEDLRKDTFNMDYDLDVVKPKNAMILSVRLSIESSLAGRAHPAHQKRVVNFDLNTGKEITLSELFKPHSKFLQTLSAYSSKSLNAKLKNENWMISTGTKPDIKNFKNWNIQEDSLLITFDEYQVAPYANGPQEVEIPYSALKKILSTKAPIALCAEQSKGCAVG